MAAPKGNQNSSKGRAVRDAMNKALKQYEDDTVQRGQALYYICRTQVKKAMEGDKDAVSVVFDRTEGKAVATNVLETGEGGFTINIVS